MIDPDLLVQAIDTADHGVYLCDPEGTLLYVNPGFCRICGYAREELIGSPISIVRSGQMDNEYYRDLWNTLLQGRRWQEEITNRRKNGELYIAYQIITPIFGAKDEHIAFLGIQQEIDESGDSKKLTRDGASELESVFSNTQDALFLIDVVDGSFIYRKLSASHQQMTGLSNADVVGRTPKEVFGAENGSTREDRYQRCVNTKTPVTFEETVYPDHGERILETKVSPIARSGRVVQLIGSSRDITRQKRFESELRYLSEMDMLTNIPNRRKASEELDRELSRAQRHGHSLSVLLIDVDHFKRVNDDLGHETGDAALRAIASTLQACLRPSDRVGRWGGEEFVIILPETDHAGARIAAERIREAVENASILNDRPITVSVGLVSTGKAPARSNEEPSPTGLAHSPESLLRIADEELYRAKENGRNQISG